MIAGLVVLLLGVTIVRMLVGYESGIPSANIALRRFQPLITGAVVGAALSVSGVLLQALLRNPLASPYILGISSGASLGVMVALYLPIGATAGATLLAVGVEHLAALAGAMLTMLVVYALAQRRGWIDPLELLLVGIVVNAINGAAIMFVNYLMPHGKRADIALWMMGYFNQAISIGSWPWHGAFWVSPIALIGILTVAGIAIAYRMGAAMDVATLGDDEAHGVGLNLGLLRFGLFALAAVLTSGTVVLAGPISFVGLICPHVVRLLIGPSHRLLVIGSALAGSTLVIGADAGIRLLSREGGLKPVGLLTALIGGPVFLWLLRRGAARERAA